jgi:protein-S-isoprenylcysteine O-methyltransferase Ste14
MCFNNKRTNNCETYFATNFTFDLYKCNVFTLYINSFYENSYLSFKSVGSFLILIGISIAYVGSNMFKAIGTTEMTFGQPSTLVTGGIYKITRNPMYLGLTQILIGTAIILSSITPFIIVIIFIVITNKVYIGYEEKVLEEKFGEEYVIYKTKVRRWI